MSARPVGPGFSPLAERLALVPGQLSPAMAQLAVQFGTQLPFAAAARLLSAACGTRVPHDTVRRLTERAGAVWWQLELELVHALETVALDPQAGPVAVPDQHLVTPERPVQLSIDGAMVPLVDGAWAEVRTLVVGEVAAAPSGPKATALSSMSALASATDFSRLVLGELTRRGVPHHAGPIVAITDGAVWIQEVLDLQCPRAVRILDIMHAIGDLADAAKAAFGPGTAETSEWLAVQRHALRQGNAGQVLAALAALPPDDTRATAIRYLSERRSMLDYARCDATGWPVGSGAVESANKVLVEARLKGAGMHWSRRQVTPMVALRALDTSDRWATAWPRIVTAWRADHRHTISRRRAARIVPAPLAAPVVDAPPPCAPAPVPAPRPKLGVDGKPTAEHPWRQSGRKRRSPAPDSH